MLSEGFVHVERGHPNWMHPAVKVTKVSRCLLSSKVQHSGGQQNTGKCKSFTTTNNWKYRALTFHQRLQPMERLGSFKAFGLARLTEGEAQWLETVSKRSNCLAACYKLHQMFPAGMLPSFQHVSSCSLGFSQCYKLVQMCERCRFSRCISS